MAELSRSDIEHLARLARLNLIEEEMERYAGQLSRVVEYIEQLNAVDTARAGEVSGLELQPVADIPNDAFFDREAALDAAPLREGDFIEVRAVLGGEVEAA